MTTPTQQRTTPRWALSFLAAIVAVLAVVFAAATTSAATTGVAETRVGASDVPATVLVGPPEHIAAGQRLGEAADRVVTTVATGVAANNGYVDVLSPGSRKHILDGDASGGGHRWPGAPGKSPYPKSWSDDQVIHNVGDIATDPGTVWRVQTGNGGIYTSSGRPAIWRAWEVRDGTRIRVAYEPATGRVVTAFPDTGPAKGAIVP